MQATTARRWGLLAGALALSLAATGWLGAQEGGDDEVAPPATAASQRSSTAGDRSAGPGADLRIGTLARRPSDAPVKDLFGARNWQSPPPAPALRQDPPPPSAPALPFVYLGKMIYDGATTVFLGSQDRTYTVKVGDVIDGNYRIDGIKGPLLTLNYLPLDTQQTMHIGDQN